MGRWTIHSYEVGFVSYIFGERVTPNPFEFFFLGDTGPLVYPAGFVYIYSILYFITSRGANIRLAQYIFITFYLMQMALVLRLYIKSRKVPPYVLIISAFTSYRIHSIYVLRLFNDPIAILFLYIALNLFLDGEWTLGSAFYSLAVSVKMNILLFAPALLVFYITNLGVRGAVKQLIVCAIFQLLLGSPFLFTHPLQYIQGSFDLGRVFEHKWTVNYRFLSRPIFENRLFHLALLLLHIGLLAYFTKPTFKYFQNYARLRQLQKQFQPQIDAKNAEVKSRNNKKKKEVVAVDEKLTEEQEKFLKSFEQGLKKTAGKPAAMEGSHESEEAAEKYSVHFEQCTQLALLPLFFCNFLGMMCARSLHYQFYIWYFHTLPYLAWSTPFSTNLKFLILFLIEYCWNTYPSTNLSSGVLHLCHFALLIGVGHTYFKSLTLGASIASKTKES